MELITFAIFGLVIGAIARMLHPGRDPMNWVWTMLLGMGGALLGGLIGRAVGVNTEAGLLGWLAAIGGAIALLVVYYAVTARRTAGYRPAAAEARPATSDDYKKAVFDDLSRGPRG